MSALIEEYCNYVLSRNSMVEKIEFSKFGFEISKEKLLTTLTNSFAAGTDFDNLLIKAIKKNVRETRIFNGRDDETLKQMSKIQASKRDSIVKLYNNHLPFSYERVFELLVYYIRMIINRNHASFRNQDPIHYETSNISDEDVLKCININFNVKDKDTSSLNVENILGLTTNPFPIALPEDVYLKFMLLATYQYNKEIEGGY